MPRGARAVHGGTNAAERKDAHERLTRREQAHWEHGVSARRNVRDFPPHPQSLSPRERDVGLRIFPTP